MPEQNGPILALDNVHKEYGTGAQTLSILRGISLNLDHGQSAAVVGPSGCGKSTLLNIIGGLDYPSSGTVTIREKVLSELPEKDLALLRNHEIGFVFQLHHLLPQCTVWENVMVPTLPFSGQNTTQVRERAENLLDTVGLLERRDHRPAELSGGERQRVAVVRALINEPSVLLADEPTGSLDPETATSLIELLVRLNRDQNVTLVVVTHALELAQRMGTVYHLRNGVLQQSEDSGGRS